MQHLFSPEGEAALVAVIRQRPLMAFDFDGTLTPIVSRPDAVRISQAVASRMKVLATRLPVAVVTGRALADVRDRLDFVPRFLVGSHGAEDDFDPAGSAARAAALDGLRRILRERAGALTTAGVRVEDKGASIALHFRLAHDRHQAQALITELLSPVRDALQVFGGKMVVNAMAAGAPDKAEAVRSLVARCGAAAAFYAGDDVNDEPVFASAPPHWLTLRIGRDAANSSARFGLDGPREMPLLLQRVLALLDAPTR